MIGYCIKTKQQTGQSLPKNKLSRGHLKLSFVVQILFSLFSHIFLFQTDPKEKFNKRKGYFEPLSTPLPTSVLGYPFEHVWLVDQKSKSAFPLSEGQQQFINIMRKTQLHLYSGINFQDV